MWILRLVGVAAALLITMPVQGDLLESVRYVPATEREAREKTSDVPALADRKIYWNDDPVGQFVFNFVGQEVMGKSIAVEVVDGAGKSTWKQDVGPLTEPKVAMLLRVSELKPGAYTCKATLAAGEKPVERQVAFTRENKSKEKIAVPQGGIAIEVQPQTVMPDGSWPIVMGVPFPQGTVDDLTQLALTEDGKAIPAQIDLVSTWHPRSFNEGKAGNDYKPSVRWAHVKFVATYANGKPKAYKLVRGKAAAPATAVKVEQTADAVTVDTGAMRFEVSRKAFAGISAAWVGGQQVLVAAKDAAFGPYVQDQRGIIFESRFDAKPVVEVEEAGPVRAVIVAEGWYVNPQIKRDEKAPRLCKFRTRFIAYAGSPDIRVQHHTILTYDSDHTRLMDLGWKLPMTGVKTWTIGVDGKPVGGAFAKDAATFMHQYRWNKLRVLGAGKEPVAGEKADGYVTVAGDGGAATICLRDIWQKFPKELEVEADGAVVHFWPEHGMRTFNEEELYGQADLYKLRFFHQGRLMDLHFPSAGYDAIQEILATSRDDLDPEGMRNAAISGNAQGMAIGSDLLIHLAPSVPPEAAATDATPLAKLFQINPLARIDPKWSVSTQVEGKMRATDREQFPEVEQAIDEYYPMYMKGVVERASEYGMFIYANWHNAWLPDINQPRLHRVWQNGHYQQVGIPWLLLMRGASFDLLPWARAYGDNFRDIGTVNYSDETYIPFHNVGSMYHAKGFMPWGSAGADAKFGSTLTWGAEHAYNQSHFVNPDAYLLRYLMEGDLRAWDCYRTWVKVWSNGKIWGGASRETINALGESINAYVNFHDPEVLRAINIYTENILTVPMTKMPAPYHHPVWHLAWFTRLQDMTRDPRIGPAVVEWCGTYEGHIAPNIFAYRTTGDAKYLQRSMAGVYDELKAIYRNPSDPTNGYCGGWSSYNSWFYRILPYYEQALVDAKIPGIQKGTTPFRYTIRATHPQFIPAEGPALLLVALDPDDRAFKVHLETNESVYQPAWQMKTPSGKTFAELLMGQGNVHFTGDKAVDIVVERDGEKGAYVLDFRAWEGVTFKTPYTNLPVEGAVWEPGRDVRTLSRTEGFLMPYGEGVVTMTFTGLKRYDTTTTAYVQMEDAAGKMLVDDTLLFGSLRPKLTVVLDPARNPGPYHLLVNGYYGPEIKIEGKGGMVFAATAEAAKQLAPAAAKVVGQK